MNDAGIIFEEKIILSVQILFYFGFKLPNINAQKTNATLNTFIWGSKIFYYSFLLDAQKYNEKMLLLALIYNAELTKI